MKRDSGNAARGVGGRNAVGAAFVALTLVLAAVASGRPALQGAKKTQEAAPAIRYAHGGNAAEIPMELAANVPFVPARVDNGRPSSWLLDTASLASTVDPGAAQRLGFDPAAVKKLALPAVEILAPRFGEQKLDELGPWYGQRATGVLGLDFLRRVVAELDYARLSIEVYDPASYHSGGNGSKLDVRWIDGLPTIPAKLRLAGREVEGNFVLNTGGSTGIVVSSRFLAAHKMFPFKGVTMDSTAVDVKGARSVWKTRGTWLQLGSSHLSTPLVSISKEEGEALEQGREIKRKKKKDGVAGWIGGRILRKYRVVLDFPQNRVYLEPNRDFIFPMYADASGATVTAAGPGLNKFEIRKVLPGSPAAEAGLWPGDRIVSVNGESAKDLSLDQIRELLREQKHSPVLVVRRLERKLVVELKLRDLL